MVEFRNGQSLDEGGPGEGEKGDDGDEASHGLISNLKPLLNCSQ